MIIEEYDESLFISRFEDYKRVETKETPNGNFSYEGLRVLFEYLDESFDEENPLKLDVISLCCDYSEYKNIEEYLRDYKSLDFDGFIKEEKPEYLKEYERHKKDSIKNGVNVSETLYNWMAFIKKDVDLLNEYSENIQEEIENETTLIKFGEDLNKGFIIATY